MNVVILCGRLTSDPEVRHTGDKMVASYSLAVDRRVSRNNGETTADFIRCVCWEKKAEFAEQYLHKGTKIIIRGRIQTGSYTGKDGKKVYTTDVVVEDQEFAESKKTAEATKKADDDGFMSIPDGIDEEMPFN